MATRSTSNTSTRALQLGVDVTEPYTGKRYFGADTILGPNEIFYREMLDQVIIDDAGGRSRRPLSSRGTVAELDGEDVALYRIVDACWG